VLDKQCSPVKSYCYETLNWGGQDPIWAVEPYDDDDDDLKCIINYEFPCFDTKRLISTARCREYKFQFC
jgi:hypothetical protein